MRLIYDPKKRGINELLIQKKFKVKYKNKNLFTIRDFGGSTAARGHNVLSFETESLNFCLLNLNINDNSFNDKIIAYPICIHN